MADWELTFERVASGDDEIRSYSFNLAHWPIERESVIVKWFKLGDIATMVAGFNDEDELPYTRLHNRADIKTVGSNGHVSVEFRKAPEAHSEIWVKYRWQPSQLRGAKFKVEIDGQEREITLAELREALKHSE